MDPTDVTHVNLVNLSTALSATHKATVKFWNALKFEKKGQHEPCQVFCEKLVVLLTKSHVHLPDGHDLGCYEDDHGETHCDMPLAAEDITEFGDHTEHDLHDYHEEEVEVENPPEAVADIDIDEGKKLDYTVEEMAVRVANLFRIYPELKVHVTERRLEAVEGVTERRLEAVVGGTERRLASFYDGGHGGSGSHWRTKVVKVNLKAQAYVSHAIQSLVMRQAGKHLRTWFGSISPAGAGEVLRVLNSIHKMFSNVEYVYPGPKCKPQSYAYVYPKAKTCMMIEVYGGEPCTQTADGSFVFYLCKLWMMSPLAEQIETLIHDGSHHAVAYTDDVTVPWGSETAFGRSTCQQLAKSNSDLALKNADNYCYFIQDATDRR